MKKESKFDLKKRALRCLTQREHTRAELERKLAPHGLREEIERFLDELADAGLLSDERFAESWLRGHFDRFGSARLRGVLREKGVDEALIDDQLAALPDEIERARLIWQRKFGHPPVDARDWARQARFLAQRGFSSETIRRLLREAPEAGCAA